MKVKKRYILVTIVFLAGIFFAINYTPDIPLDKLKSTYTNDNSQFIQVENIEVHYRREGEGPSLLLLHGTASSLHTWDSYTEQLSDSFEIVRLDLPGFGLTGPFMGTDYSIEHYVNFLDLFVDQIGLDSFIIIGNSLGGHIAMEYSLSYPQKVNKQVLIDPAGAPYDNPSPFIFTLAKIPVINLIIKWITPKSLIKDNLEQVYFDDNKVSEGLIDRYYELTLRTGNRQAFIDRAKTPSHFFNKEDLNCNLETLVIWGKEDTWIRPEESEFFLGLPNSNLILVNECGHVPMEECPEGTFEGLLEFLNQ